MNAGEWGLVQVNDPDVFLECDFELPKTYEQYIELIKAFDEQLWVRPEIGHQLYVALSKVKYSFAVRRLWAKYAYTGRFNSRLYLYLAWFIKNNPIKQETK
jgi:hypothetical protein